MTGVPLVQLDPVTGRGRAVTVVLTGMSFRETTKGRLFPYGEFGSEFIQALHSQLVAPKRTGLLRQKLACPSCQSPFDQVPITQVAASADVKLRNIPAIRVDGELPGIICPTCGRTVVMIHDRNVESDLSDAVIDAFKAADVRPG